MRRHDVHTMVRAAACALMALLALAVALALLAASARADAPPVCTVTWDGGGSDSQWTTAQNWSGEALPTADDVVCLPTGAIVTIGGDASAGSIQGDGASLTIANGTLTVADVEHASAVATLAISGGVVSGAGDLHATTTFSWTGGALSGTGTTTVDDGATGTINPGGGSSTLSLSGRTLTNRGSVTFAEGGLSATSGAIIRNAGTLTLDTEADTFGAAVRDGGGSPKPQLTNAAGATLRKTAGAGTTRLTIAVDNEGAIDAQSGRLDFAGGGGPSTTGTWEASGIGTAIVFSGGDHMLGAGTQLGGAILLTSGSVTAPDAQIDGDLTITGGTLSLTGSRTSTTNAYTQSGGTLTGDGELDVAGAVAITGGVMSGAGSTILQPTSTGAIDTGDTFNALALDQRTFSVRGALTLASGLIRAFNGATVRTSGTLTLNSQNDFWGVQLYDGGGSPRPQLINTGTIVKSAGTGVSTIGLATDSSGTIQARSGSIRFLQSDVATTFEDGAVLKGSILLSGANVTAGDVDATAAQLALSNGSLAVDAGKTLTAGTLSQSGGTLTGAGDARVAETLAWTGGQMTGSGTTTVTAGADATITPGESSSSVALDQRALDNHGTLTLVNGTLRGVNGAALRNHATLKLNSQTDWFGAQLHDGGGSPHPQLINTGTVVKDAGTGTTGIGWEVDNRGTIDADAGRLAFPSSAAAVTLQDGSAIAGALTFNGASITAVGAVHGHEASVRLENGAIAAAAGAVLALGSLTQPGGTLTGAGQVQVDDALTWTGGQMTGTGSTILQPDGNGTIDAGPSSNSVALDARTLSNRGGLTFASGTLRALNAATLRNSGTLTLNSENDWFGSQVYDSGGDDSSLINTATGTLRKTGGSGSTRVNIPFDNEGAVDAQSGRLDFGGGGGPSTAGTWSATGAGTSVQFSGGAFTLGADAQGAGALRVTDGSVTAPDLQLEGGLTVTGGTLALTDDGTTSHARALTQSGGTIDGAGTLALSTTLSWTGGQMTGAGETALGSAGIGTIAAGGGSAWVALEQRTLRNAGDLTFTSGTLRALNGATVRNEGALNFNSENDWFGQQLYDAGGVARPRLVNAASGTVRKTAGGGTTSFGVATESDGTIDAQTGQFRFNQSNAPVSFDDGSTLAGTITIANAPVTVGDVHGEQADVRLDDGTLSARSGAHAVLGTLRQNGGAITGAGDVAVSGLAQLDGGQQTGTGTTTIGPDATGTIAPGTGSAWIAIDQRTLSIEGAIEHVNGTIRMLNGGGVDVAGTLTENSQADWFGPSVYDSGGALSHVLVKPGGLLQKSAGTGTSGIGVPTQNEGKVKVTGGGTIELGSREDVPDQPCTSGGWEIGPDGSHVLMSSGPRCLAADTELHGEFQLKNSARLTVANIDGADADFDLQGGTLNVTDTSTPTTLRSLHVNGGTLTGDGEVDVQGLFAWTAGTMSGLGSTVVENGASGQVDTGPDSGSVLLDQRTLTLNGTTTFPQGTVRTGNGATIRNGGTLTVNSQNDWFGGVFHDNGGSAPSKFLNLAGGTLRKLTGTGTTGIDIAFDNQGAVDAETGGLRFSRGGVPVSLPPVIDDPILCPQPRNPQYGSWTTSTGGGAEIDLSGPDCFVLGGGTVMTGTIHNTGATILAGSIQGLGATFYHEGGKLSFEDRNIPSVLGTLHLSANMEGPGEVDICDQFTWQGGVMSGTGATVICPGASGDFTPPFGDLQLQRALINSGSLTWGAGGFAMREGALFYNEGTFHANGETGTLYGDASGLIDNVGTIVKDSGNGTTTIDQHIDNPGTVQRATGTLINEGQTCQANNSGTGEGDQSGGGSDPQPEPSAFPPDPADGAQRPGPEWEWHGKEPEGGDKGAWVNPDTDEVWHPDLGHAEPIGGHWDFGYKGGDYWRWTPDGGFSPKQSACA
ncbi:hypothetical protein DSM104299_00435 [Baekduia alba]|nr:hypothetical protein DSM104299_00435 [Baekduia alba]